MQDEHQYDAEEEENYGEYCDEVATVPKAVVEKARDEWGKLRVQIGEDLNSDGKKRITIKARKSAFVSSLIYLDGSRFSFKGREYLEPIYDRNDPEILLKTARQVEKSTYLSNNLVINSVINPYNKSLYVSPSHMQTRQFSSEKLKPVIDKSPLIATYFQDNSVSQQVFEKGFLNGSFIFLRSAYRTADRARGISARNLCLFSDNVVYTKNKGIVKLKELVPGDEVLASDIEAGKTVYAPVVKTWITGVKPTLTITTKSGKTVRLTPDHRLYSWDGWKEAQELKVGDYLLTEAPQFATKRLLGKEAALFIGLLLGDGSVEKTRCIDFRNTDKVLLEIAAEAASYIDTDFTRRSYTKIGNLTKKKITEHMLCFRTNSAMENLLKELGIFGQKNVDKEITFFDRIGREEAIGLLSGLFVTDGCVCSGLTPNNKSSPYHAEAVFLNTSINLCKAVQTLLSMLGIKSQFRFRGTPDNGVSVLQQYTVAIRDLDNFRKFTELVPMPTKEYQVKNALEVLKQVSSQRTKSDLLPITGRQLCVMLNNKLGKGAITKFKKEVHPISSTDSRTSKEVITLAANYLEDNNLLSKLNHAGQWEDIIKIEKSGPCEVRDIAILGVHNLFVEGILAHNCLDEAQDLICDQIPVIRECTSHFVDSTTMIAGTPKSLNNPLEIYWQATSQNEWLVPCTFCGKWNFLDEQNIAPTADYESKKIKPGPVCRKCGKSIDVTTGQWVMTCARNSMKGYRIPQLMVPWICGIYSQWQKLLWKRDNYPLSQFYNEALGISYDSANNPITLDEILEICGDYDMWDLDNMTSVQVSEARNMLLTGGVDWGEGLDGAEKSPSGKLRPASYTVLTLGHYHRQDQFKVVAIKKFTGKEADPDYVVQFISQISKMLGVCLVGVDWGHGWGVNNILVRMLGANRVVQFQHLPKLATKMKWDPIGFRYHLHRNFMMSELFYDMKNKFLIFPKWGHFEPYSKDIFSIYTEYNEYKRDMKYDHRHSEPDDFFHSLLYCKLASDIHLGKTRRFTRMIDSEAKN